MDLSVNFYGEGQHYRIHELLRSARQHMGYTQAYVAQCIRMSTRQYVKYEKGELDIADISFQQGINLCELLHIEIYQLITPIEKRLTEATK